jgi:hypothetical protein
VLPFGVLRCAALVSLTWGGVAYAEDPREVFGFTQKPAVREECTDWKTFGCPTGSDDFDHTSPHALRTWLPSSYLLSLPVADSRHDDVAHFATGATRDEAGPAFLGATGLENVWTVEGIPIENPRNGNVETRIPLAFTRGLLVVAGGFAARDRAALGGSIDVELRRGGDSHEVDAYVWSGYTTDARARPIPAQTFQLRRLTIAPELDTSFAVVASGPAPSFGGGKTWYAAGLAGTVSTFAVDWKAARLVDRDGDTIPDGLPGTLDAGADGKVDLETITQTGETVRTLSVPMMARGGWERGPHDITLTLLGIGSVDSAFLSNATQQAAGTDRHGLILDGIAAWKGSWKDTRGRLLMAWHRSTRREKARDDAAANISQFQSAYIPAVLDDDPTLADRCSDDIVMGDPYPGIPNCPIPFGFFSSGGAGDLVTTVADRPVVTADVARRYGNHVLRAGGTFEDTRLVQTTRFTGNQLVRSLLPGHTDRVQFFSGECGELAGTPCDYTSFSRLNYRTRYTAAYLEDTFALSPRIRVNTGVRWELMWVGPTLHFSDQIAPRLGIAWDLRGDGSSRLWTNMGRTHAILPAGMGSTVIARDRTVRDIEFVTQMQTVTDRRIDNGNVFAVAQDIDSIAQDEIATGIEIGVIKALRAGAWIAHRSLRHGLETTLVNQTGELAVANPGDGGPFLGRTATREATTVAADVLIAPAPKLSFRLTYLWGRVVGSWPGPFDPRQGATLYAGNEWDLDATNLYGRLPSDPGHRVAIEAERRGKLGPVELAVATRLTVANGRPRNILADGELGVVYVLPRGAGGRNPTLSQANVRGAARWRGTDFTVDVFNVFARQEATATGELYAGDQVRPIVNGTVADLVFLKNESCGDAGCVGRAATRRSGFGLPTAFQSPLSVVVGVHRTF